MSQYSETLHAVAGFLAVEPSPARAEFDHFLDTVAVDGRLPGVQATGVADRVRTEDLPAFTAAVSADTQKPGTAYPPFTIRPEIPDPEHMVISYLHPQEGNEAAFGFDFLAEGSRRDAVLRARDSGSLSATSPVVLVQETGNQRGVLVMVPLYRAGAATTSTAERRAAFVGVAYQAFRMGDLLEATIGAGQPRQLEIYDVGVSGSALPGKPTAGMLMYASQERAGAVRAGFPEATTVSLDIGGRHWVVVSGSPPSGGALYSSNAWLVLVVGTLVAVLAAALVLVLSSARATALRLASAMTAALHSVTESASDAIITADAHGTVVAWNSGAQSLFGWTAADMIGTPLQRVVPPGALDEHAQNIAAAFSDGGDGILHRPIEVTARRSDDSQVLVELVLSTWESDDGQYFTGIARDATERTRARRELERAFAREQEAVERLQQLDRVKSEFVSTVSHELRTPLTSITGYLELLSDGGAGEVSPPQRRMVDVITRNADRLLLLSQDLLTLSSVESGAWRMNHAPLDLRAVVSSAVEAVAPIAASAGLSLQVDLPATTVAVEGDRRQLERLLLNLLGNAVKFTDAGGSVDVVLQATSGAAVLTVRDNGCGLCAADQKQLFERFFRASTAQQREVQGTGLGLSIAYNIVEQHGGSITVRSALGAGSEFKVALPVPVGFARDGRSAHEVSPRPSRARDDAVRDDVVRRQVAGRGCER